MSTFTNWNGPQGSDVRASDLLELAKQYSILVTEVNSLKKRIEDDYVSNNVLNATLNSTLNTALENYAKNDDIPNVSSLIDNATLNTTLENYAKNADIPNVSSLVDKGNFESNNLSTILSGYVQDNSLSNSYYSKDELNTKFAEKDTNIENNYINKNVTSIKLNDTDIKAPVGGSDSDGVFYILGMLDVDVDNSPLSLGAGTVFISHVDDSDFSARVDYTVFLDSSKEPVIKAGEMDVIMTKSNLNDVTFKLVYGTSNDNRAHTYLAVQSSAWFRKTADSGFGVQMFESIDFKVSGINFVPVGNDRYAKPNGQCMVISRVEPKSSLTQLGTICMWHSFEEVLDDDGNLVRTSAVDVPKGYHACDGTAVLITDDVDEEFRELFSEYPLVDFCIIRTKK